MNKRLYIAHAIMKVKSFAKRVVRSEFLIVSSVLIIFVLLFFAPTLIKGKLPISSSYLAHMYPWAYYGSHQAGEVSNDVLSDQYDSQICANTANTMCVNTVC